MKEPSFFKTALLLIYLPLNEIYRFTDLQIDGFTNLFTPNPLKGAKNLRRIIVFFVYFNHFVFFYTFVVDALVQKLWIFEPLFLYLL